MAEITFRGLDEAASGPAWENQETAYITSFTVYTLDDDLSEPSGSITVSLGPSIDPYYRLGSPSRASVAVLDDDVGSVNVTADAASVVEGQEAVFTVHRVGAAESELRVWVNIPGHTKTVSDATLTLAENRGPGPDVEVVLAAGAASAEVRLGTEADNLNEGDGRRETDPVGRAWIRGGRVQAHGERTGDGDGHLHGAGGGGRAPSSHLEVSRRRFADAESQDAVVLRGTLRRGPRVGPERPVRAGAEEARSAAPPATPSPR